MKKLFSFLNAEKNLLIPEQAGKNNFDCLRFFLASAVIYSHSFAIYYAKVKDTEPVSIFTRNQCDLGSIAVCFFFVISGFLIVRSFEYSSSNYEYLAKRILRICPGFFVAFLISVFILGPLGTINATHKFGQWGSYLEQLNPRRLVIQFFTLESPGSTKTFSTNPLRNMVNESFWTIQYEFICYLLVPLLGIFGMVKRKWLGLVFFLVSYIILVLQSFQFITITDHPRNWVLLWPSTLPNLLSFFFAGSCCYFYRNYIPKNRFLMLLSIASILFASWWVRGMNLVLPLAGTYLLFYFAYNPRIQLHDFAKRGDFSYGLYLYAWPVQQLVLHFFAKHLDVYRLFFISYPLVFIFAYLSWHIVEGPFLEMKSRLKNFEFIRQKKEVNV